MDRVFDKESTKKKCARVLLSCLDWGCHPKKYTDIEETIKKRLNFQYNFDTIRFRSCIDLIEDTEDAICHFSKFGLQRFNSKEFGDIGEIYIKFYGVLNAVYLQIYSIVEIFEVCRIPNKKANLNRLKEHKIFELRNIGGAHTVNYDDSSDFIPENFNKNFFRIAQSQLNAKGDNLLIVDGFHNVKKYNLYNLIIDYNKVSEKILYDATIKYMDSIFSSSDNKKHKLLEHYELIPFKSFNYIDLYENDKLQKQNLKSISKSINRMKKKMKEEGLDDFDKEISFEDIHELMINKIRPPNQGDGPVPG